MKNDKKNDKRDIHHDVDALLKENSKKDKEIEKLKNELKEQTEKVRRYEDEMVSNSVMDRWKIGKYLHDNLAQKLTFGKIMINLFREKLSDSDIDTAELDDISRIMEEGAREIRDLSHDIIPVNIEKEALSEAFKYLEERARSKHNVNCQVSYDEILQKIDSREIATNLYHIAQEAIKNAIIHGEAKNIDISILEEDRHLCLNIKDDGKGFDNSAKADGMGITIMKHRAEEIGGDFSINGSKDGDNYSTCVTCRLPLDQSRNGQVNA